jgi:hypothetical protein
MTNVGKAPRETTQEGVPVQEARKEFGELLASFTSAPISVSWSGLFSGSLSRAIALRADRCSHQFPPAATRLPHAKEGLFQYTFCSRFRWIFD